jgi:transposase
MIARSVRKHASHAVLTFDRFHVTKLMTERLDNPRRELVREADFKQAKQAIKGLRRLLLSRQENLSKNAKKTTQ